MYDNHAVSYIYLAKGSVTQFVPGETVPDDAHLVVYDHRDDSTCMLAKNFETRLFEVKGFASVEKLESIMKRLAIFFWFSFAQIENS